MTIHKIIIFGAFLHVTWDDTPAKATAHRWPNDQNYYVLFIHIATGQQTCQFNIIQGVSKSKLLLKLHNDHPVLITRGWHEDREGMATPKHSIIYTKFNIKISSQQNLCTIIKDKTATHSNYQDPNDPAIQ